MFQLISKFKPTGDQPQAIKKLSANLQAGKKHQVLLGVTGSGKTFTMANVIAKYQKPTLIISPNKTLAAQLYQEMKEFFPHNGVHYFVSYYDYYQPEAYLPQTDTYIEKDAKINQEIDRLRHFATQDVLSRADVIVVASVSCIYNIGSPQNYQQVSLHIKAGQKISRKDFILQLIMLQYKRNDIESNPGTFRVRGEYIEIFLVTGEKIVKIEFNDDKIGAVFESPNGTIGNYKLITNNYILFPATFWVAPQDKIKLAIGNIQAELASRLQELKKQGKLVEHQRLQERVSHDIEMLQENGWCQGIENYSSHLEFRQPGSPPFSLVDYFNYASNNNFLMIIDESHISIPQIGAMSVGDKARKQTLIDFGFRLPSAKDNRPLNFKEFQERQQQSMYVSATPAEYELGLALQAGKSGGGVIQQIIRPTGLLEPSIEVKPTTNQMKDVILEIEKEVAKNHRVLVITLTKRLAEEISSYMEDPPSHKASEGQRPKIKSQYLHSEVKTMERPKILQEFREGKFDVLVGINLLREGLDLPEVALVAILDADKEGFLRNKTMLIQTMGRAARHLQGRVILYGDHITLSMRGAIDEINRRRKIQEAYNKKHGITPEAIVKSIRDWGFSKPEEVAAEFGPLQDRKLLEKEMKLAAKNLDFERAVKIRDLIKKMDDKKS